MTNEMSVMTFKLPQSLREKMKERARAEERSESGFLRYHLGLLLNEETDDSPDEEEMASVSEG
jgi:Arc/MetJ-type ribon-helix-helix transcriptional regulator